MLVSEIKSTARIKYKIKEKEKEESQHTYGVKKTWNAIQIN